MGADVKASSRPAGERHLFFVEVQLASAGNVQLQAKQTKLDGFVYRDEAEQLRFGCSLQIKRVNTEKLTGPLPVVP
jgi:hypothetical protein